MYLKKIELVGFKSFMEKTTLNFEPGITAVVGPNGSGKSNIVDGIRWVLGEQSVKSLRGSQMEDVIFKGTDTKEPLGMAEVSLTFENEKRYFSVDLNDVVVTRRIFRSGESEYLLNKAPVRLKDILDIFTGTGIGAESYSFVQQGKIDLILSSKPEDRRLVFDEAAGITKFKGQKKEAVRKMEEMQQNLLRVNDIITEVKRQISSLERQANKARRYKEVFEELKSKEIISAAFQKKELERQKGAIENEINDLEAQEASLLAKIKDAELKISSHQAELNSLKEDASGIKNELINLDNFVSRNNERMELGKERITELDSAKAYLSRQIEQTKARFAIDEQKFGELKQEYSSLNKIIEGKKGILKNKEAEFESLNLSTKEALVNIDKTKLLILGLATKTANIKNEINDLASREQVHLARKKRLEIEKAKVGEERALVENDLNAIKSELEALEDNFNNLNSKLSAVEKELDDQQSALNEIIQNIDNLEKQKLTLQSNREFMEKLRMKYEALGESMNAVIYLDRAPVDKVTGLVVKIKENSGLSPDEKERVGFLNVKFSGEAKPIDLDTERISEKINQLEEKTKALEAERLNKQSRIEELNKVVGQLEQDLRSQEMSLVNKKASYQSVLSVVNKINDEEEIIRIELSDIQQEISSLEGRISQHKNSLVDFSRQQQHTEEAILSEEKRIAENANLKEKALVEITQIKTELEALNKRLISDLSTLELLENSCNRGKEGLLNFENQLKETDEKKKMLSAEIKDLEGKLNETLMDIEVHKKLLKETEEKYKEISQAAAKFSGEIEGDKNSLDAMKQGVYELQMQGKDTEFKYINLKERILNAYKTGLDTLNDPGAEFDPGALGEEIQGLKEKLDSYGTVNLVAIEEHDELKKRYDFLNQQQEDLNKSKEALHEVILKINRTTKKIFLETFEKVGEEFHNYFRLLFNGGDARIFLANEDDPLESGIEIICRPPGRKLQNVLLLSGGEKSLSAIALIFAIFKVKPSPFCVLDEIDAALDEANVDRFTSALQEFTRNSQFIVITHNKKTIANADAMYGITMEDSGISKIISVRFMENKKVEVESSVEPVAGAVLS